MKLLVLSDSHSGRSFMRLCIEKIKPDAIVHVGDYESDGEVVQSENPGVPFYQVPGNCDYGFGSVFSAIRIENIGGIRVFMTHGHRHGVKSGTERLIADGRSEEAQLILYGHTHIPDCHPEPGGIWVVNPGSCRSYDGSVAVVTIENCQIKGCKILRMSDLEEIL